MRMRRLTAADACGVTGYNRDQLRGLLKELPEWTRAPAERKARTFSPQDLVVLSVVHTLDAVMDIRRKTIAAIFPQLRSVLSGPKRLASSARLVIAFAPLRVEYVDADAPTAEGVVVALQPILDRIDRYLGSGRAALGEPQTSLELGPGLLRNRRRR
jgi:hypothetical protein